MPFFIAPQTERLDYSIQKQYPDLSRRQIKLYLKNNSVYIDGKRASKGTFVSQGSTVSLENIPQNTLRTPVISDDSIVLNILYEDKDFVVINKEPTIPCHPLIQQEQGTIANGIVARYPECALIGNDLREAGLVHRLDTGTSGCLIAARNKPTWLYFRDMFVQKQILKEYLALVHTTKIDTYETRIPIGKLSAKTTWSVQQQYKNHALLLCHTQTGRRHQIRIHMSNLNWPIAGDTTYNPHHNVFMKLKGHFLHASKIIFPHPVTKETTTIEAPLSQDRMKTMNELEL